MSRSNNNSEQIALQRASLLEQQRANDAQISFLENQTKALAKTQVAAYKPLSPPPTAGTSGADQAAAQELINNQRRFGYSDTVRGGMRLGLGRAAA